MQIRRRFATGLAVAVVGVAPLGPAPFAHAPAATRLAKIDDQLREDPTNHSLLRQRAALVTRNPGVRPVGYHDHDREERRVPSARQHGMRAGGVGSAQVVLLDRASEWRYDDRGVDLGVAWRAPTFDDSSWESGPGFLGYGENMVTTSISFGGDPDDKHRTAYFRTTFDLDEDPLAIQRLLLGVNYDDGMVLYLNGTEVARLNLPGGVIQYATFASSTVEGEGHEHVDLSSFIGLLVIGENALAAEVHQRTATSSDLIWDMKLQVSTQSALITRGPFLQLGSPSGATIRWRTDVAHRGRVRYGTDPAALNDMADDIGAGTFHSIELSGLAPATRYYYSVGTADDEVLAGGDLSHAFRTHPDVGSADNSVRIWAFGDGGEANREQERVRDAYLAYPGALDTDVWLLLGDNAYDEGTDEEYQSGLFEQHGGMLRSTFVWPTRGNHDDLHAGYDYYDVFSLPSAGESGGTPSGSEAYYSFDYANIHFVCLDSDASSRDIEAPMLTWLEQDLSATDQRWLIAYWHHPPYTRGVHDSDDVTDSGNRMGEMRANALPILESHGVDLVLSGHSHSYERTFLIDEHYGPSSSLADSMVLHAGSGAFDTGGPYTKATAGLAPHEGTVYAVAGSYSFTQGGPLDHSAMRISLEEMGSMVIDVAGNRLDTRFLSIDGDILDEFTMLKGTTIDTPTIDGASDLRVLRNPTSGASTVAYSVEVGERAALRLFDTNGRLVRELANDFAGSGYRVVRWDGRDENGADVAAGIYYARLETARGHSTRTIVVVR